MKAKDMIIEAIKRSEKKRGLRVSKPNHSLGMSHLQKADHNLIVMTDLNKLGHEDWVVIAAYYSMYQSATALLAKIGLESKEHATTVAVLEYFFGEKINKEIIGKFNELKERKDRIEAITIDEKYINYLWNIKQAREAVQYGISITYKETDSVMKNAREFASKIKLVLQELDDAYVKMIDENIQELVAIAKHNK